MLPFKKGAFHVARQMKVPVAPVILPSNYDLFPVTKWYALPGVIKYVALDLDLDHLMLVDSARSLSIETETEC